MNTILVTQKGQSYLECLPGEGLLDSESAALDLVAACGEHGTDRLLLTAECLPEAFFDLRTGLAGTVLLKFSNYRIRLAMVLDRERATQGRFGEVVLEANRGNREFRVFFERAAAEAWLLGD